MKVRSYGALMGALLTISSVEAAGAATCDNVCKPSPQSSTVRHAPARAVHKADTSAEYAQSYYDYRSASRVTEKFVRRAAPLPEARDDGFRGAPNDARIRFFRDARAVYAPPMAYPQPYPSAYSAAPQPAYYPPPQEGVDLDQQGFNGGVGGMAGPGNGGGGYGGQAFLYTGQSGGSDEPANSGGVSLPTGYGPDYRGVWHGPVNPTRGGLSGH